MKLIKITTPQITSRRSYEDACGAAHALDLVGERWALLVVRELLLGPKRFTDRSEEHTSELQSLMRISYAVFCLKKKTKETQNTIHVIQNLKTSDAYPTEHTSQML